MKLLASAGCLVAAASILTGCAAQPTPAPEPAATTSSPSSSPTPFAGPLSCDGLVSDELLSAALAESTASQPGIETAEQPSRAFDSALLGAVGGFACTWRSGAAPDPLQYGGDWAYLSVDVLPGGAAEWASPPEEGANTEVEIAGVDAVATSGEFGWLVTAPVGDAWVDVSLRAAGLVTGETRFTGEVYDATEERVRQVAEEVFEAVLAADPEATVIEQRTEPARCDGGVELPGIRAALEIPESAVTDYVALDSLDEVPSILVHAVERRLSVFDCELTTEGYGTTSVTVVRDHADLLPGFATAPDADTALERITLEGAVDGETAYRTIRPDGPQSPVYFTVGDTLYRVYSDGAVSVAEAIIAQTR